MSITFQSSAHLLLFIFLSTAVNTHANNTNPDIFLTICGRNQTPNLVSFDQHFVTSMELVNGNITTSGFGVGITSGPFPAYGLGQCFNYLSSIDCQLCYAESRFKLPNCLPATDARIYLDGCFTRYSDHNFFNTAVDGLDAAQCSNSSVAASNSTLFGQNVVRLMTNLTVTAEKESEYYSAGSTVASPGVTVYGMAQCWRSLNASGCRECLESARENATGCLPASDGKALYAGCFVRYSTLPFYLSSTAANSGSTVTRRRVGVVLGLVFGTLVIVVVVIAILWIRRRIQSASPGQEGTEEIIRTIAASSLSFKYEDLKNATDNFTEINKLGQGGYGAVYKGVLPDGREVAVKRLFFNTRQRSDQFFNEVTFVTSVQHKNLVKLLGCSVEGPERLLVYEYLSNTSLDKLIYDTFKKNILNWGRRFNIIVGTAEGLAYLHSSSEVRIIHRDIKASNILLDEWFKPKIADFGLARFFEEDQSHLSTGLAGTFGYMAPEYIVHGQLTEKADTYSYGILVIEILTGRKNQNSILTSTEGNSLMSTVWQHFNSKSLIQLLDPHLHGQCSEEEVLKVFHVALLCTQASPILRPPMWKVVEMLTIESKDLPPPTEPPFTNIKGSDIKSEHSENSPVFSSSSQSRISENQMSISIFQGR